MVEEFKAEVRKLIASNKIHEVIEGLKAFSKGNERLRDEVLLIESRLSDLEEKIGKGVLDRLDEERINNQIRDSLLRLISRVNPIDFLVFVENSETVKKLKSEIETKEQEINGLKNKIASLIKREKVLEQEQKEDLAVIQKMRNLEDGELIKICDICKGEGFIEISSHNKEKIEKQLELCDLSEDEKQNLLFNFTLQQMQELINTSKRQPFYLKKSCKACKGMGVWKAKGS